MKQKTKRKTTKKRSSKYLKKLTLYGMDEKEVLKTLLKSPPMPKDTKIGIMLAGRAELELAIPPTGRKALIFSQPRTPIR